MRRIRDERLLNSPLSLFLFTFVLSAFVVWHFPLSSFFSLIQGSLGSCGRMLHVDVDLGVNDNDCVPGFFHFILVLVVPLVYLVLWLWEAG